MRKLPLIMLVISASVFATDMPTLNQNIRPIAVKIHYPYIEKIDRLPITSEGILEKLPECMIYFQNHFMMDFDQRIKPEIRKSFEERVSKENLSIDDYLNNLPAKLAAQRIALNEEIQTMRKIHEKHSVVHAAMRIQQVLKAYKKIEE